ncbi:Hypothetical predicted protein [Mytilus galloprovincialis]|uniref:Farnesoic acid O-methyl transferase domain-containing protein n=1 Tax=Mytilus galloprovincialis TaxID=29158 RepID=A0A8B6G1D5_MYTGA|nr:Hypothetical predicted protein [Mytilus galloprovincialis]
MAFGQRLFLLSIVAVKTLGLVIENTFTTPSNGHKKFLQVADILQYVVDINKNGLDLTGITTITFQVKACQDVSIIMSNSDDKDSSKSMYNFIIGGWTNSKSAIQRRNDDSLTPASQQSVLFDTPNVCKCDEYRPFWISAINGVIMMGKGLIVGRNVIAEWTDPNPFTVRSIGIYTIVKNIGEWKVQIEVVNNLYNGSFLQCTTNYKAVLNILFLKKTSLLQCAVLCDKLLSCIGLNYHSQSFSCELVALSPGVVTQIPKKQEDGWEFHTKCYRYNGACLWCYF